MKRLCNGRSTKKPPVKGKYCGNNVVENVGNGLIVCTYIEHIYTDMRLCMYDVESNGKHITYIHEK